MKLKTLVKPLWTATAILALAACGNGTDQQTGPAEKNSDGKYDLTINIGKQQDENAGRYASGDDINNNPMTRKTEEDLGIKINTSLLGGDASSYNTKLRLSLTGTEELPDVFAAYDTQIISDLIESGRLRAIDDDIEKYMPYRLKEIYDQFPETFYPVTKDGKTYGIAVAPTFEDTQVMIIRQDWLDNLGLEAPTNMEEFENVIRAFTEDDPDGNGIDDTYGFTYQGNGIYNVGWVSEVSPLFSANTGKFLPGIWQENENGELEYGSVQEGNRKTLEKMAEWHANGYLFQEAAATGAWDAMGEFTQGKAGIFIARPWAIGSVSDLIENVPGAEIKAYPNIFQDNGEPTYQQSSVNDGYILFNKDFDNMEAFFEYYDYIYDFAFGTGEFTYGFVQGEDWDEVDGEIVFDSKLFNEPKEDPFMPGKTLVTKNAPSYDRMRPYYDVVNGKTPETGAELRVAASLLSDPVQVHAYALAYEEMHTFVPNLFNGEPTETMKRNWEQLQTLEKQTYTNIIYGNAPITAFDDFVQEWKEQGGDQITQEVNEWYQTIK